MRVHCVFHCVSASAPTSGKTARALPDFCGRGGKCGEFASQRQRYLDFAYFIVRYGILRGKHTSLSEKQSHVPNVFTLFEMHVNACFFGFVCVCVCVCFVIRCLYSTVKLTLVREQHFIRIIIIIHLKKKKKKGGGGGGGGGGKYPDIHYA